MNRTVLDGMLGFTGGVKWLRPVFEFIGTSHRDDRW
jgi:hypothetical protein